MKIADAQHVCNKLEMEMHEGRDTVAKFRHEGKVLVRTRIPHGRGELEGKLPHFVRQQLHLSEDEFRLVYICTYWRPDYLRILKEKGFIPNA